MMVFVFFLCLFLEVVRRKSFFNFVESDSFLVLVRIVMRSGGGVGR